MHVNYENNQGVKITNEGFDLLATRLTPNKPGYGGYTLQIENKRKLIKQAKKIVITNNNSLPAPAYGAIQAEKGFSQNGNLNEGVVNLNSDLTHSANMSILDAAFN